jgi:hypothetical protein
MIIQIAIIEEPENTPSVRKDNYTKAQPLNQIDQTVHKCYIRKAHESCFCFFFIFLVILREQNDPQIYNKLKKSNTTCGRTKFNLAKQKNAMSKNI